MDYKRCKLDERLNRLRKGGVNNSPPDNVIVPPPPPPQRKIPDMVLTKMYLNYCCAGYYLEQRHDNIGYPVVQYECLGCGRSIGSEL